MDKGIIKRSTLRRRIHEVSGFQVSDEYIDMLENMLWEKVKAHISEAEGRGDKRLLAKHITTEDEELDLFP